MVKKRANIKTEVSLENLVNNIQKAPISSYDKPAKIETKSNDFKLGFANTIYAGSVTDKKLVKNFLKYAQADKLDAIVLTGNLLYMDLVKYSKYSSDRAKLVETQNWSEYRTFKQNLDLIIDNSLKPLFLENKKPIYKGPAYIIFGKMEEDIVKYHINEHVKFEVYKKGKEIDKKITELKSNLKELKKTVTKYDKEKEKEKKTIEESEFLQATSSIEDVNHTIDSLKKRKKEITISLRNPTNIKKTEQLIQNYLIQKIESAIPKSKVISTGKGIIKIADKVIKVKHSTGNPNTLVDRLIKKTRTNISSKTPDIIVSGGLSSAYTHAPIAYPMAWEKDKGCKTAHIIQLPTCLDDKSLEKIMDSGVDIKGSQIIRLASRTDFSTGAMVIEYVNGIHKRKILTNDYLSNDKIFSNIDEIKNYKMMYASINGDQHHGSKYETLRETQDDYIYSFVASMDLLDKINAPLVRFLSLGDETQGKNYDTDQEEHKDQLTPSSARELEETIRKKYKKDPTRLNTELKKLKRIGEVRSGILNPQDQTKDFLKILNYSLLEKVLNNSRKAKLEGPTMYFIMGNHDQHTYNNLVKTVKDLAEGARSRLNASEQEICAPIMGFGGIYYGKFGIKGHYKYGEHARHKQGSTRNAIDPVKLMKKLFLERGFGLETFTMNNAGHNHLGGQGMSKNTLHDIGYCHMDRNEYGEKFNYGSPMRGSKVIGLPIDGISTGPIVTIEFPLEYLKKWVNEKPKINTKKLFENSVV